MKLIDLKKELDHGRLTGIQRMAIQQDIIERQDKIIQSLVDWIYCETDEKYIKVLLIDIEDKIEKENG